MSVNCLGELSQFSDVCIIRPLATSTYYCKKQNNPFTYENKSKIWFTCSLKLTLFDYFHILFIISLSIHMIHAVFNACYSDRALAISLGRGRALFRDGHLNVLASDSPNVCCLNPLTGEPPA